jgi:HEAT repeat protein
MPLFGPPNIDQMEARRDVQGLIKALAWKDAPVRRAAAEALGALRDPASVDALTALLADENSGVRRAVAGALAARGGQRVVEPLVRALADTDVQVRSIAENALYKRLMADTDAETRGATATALGRLRTPESVPPLLNAIKDADGNVRIAAIKALATMGEMAAVVPLILIVARETARARNTGRSDAAMERAASQALDTLADERAVEPLKAVLAQSDPDAREVAIRRLARIGSPEVGEALAGLLSDGDATIRRAAARGLAEMKWQPAADETGARYWAAQREWRRCAECGPEAVPFLVASYPGASAMERADILYALAHLKWQPEASDPMAAAYWAAQGRYDKCIEIGEPAVEALDLALRTAPKWRARVEAAAALATLGQSREEPFAQLDLVQRALGILDAEGEDADKSGALEAFLAEQHLFDPEAEKVEFCKCGYPASKAAEGTAPEAITDLMGFERAGNITTYYCPSCDVRRTTILGEADRPSAE